LIHKELKRRTLKMNMSLIGPTLKYIPAIYGVSGILHLTVSGRDYGSRLIKTRDNEEGCITRWFQKINSVLFLQLVHLLENRKCILKQGKKKEGHIKSILFANITL
jgi:hypothetical protein